MANVTVSSSDDYVIVVDCDGTDGSAGGGAFQVRHGGDLANYVLSINNTSAVYAKKLHSSIIAFRFWKADGVVFHMMDNAAHTATWSHDGVMKARLTSDGELLLTEGLLNLPVCQDSPPASPEEGQWVIVENTTAGRARLAAYLDGAWRYSDDL